MKKDSFIGIYRKKFNFPTLYFAFTHPLPEHFIRKTELEMLCGYVNPTEDQKKAVFNEVGIHNRGNRTKEELLEKIDKIMD